MSKGKQWWPMRASVKDIRDVLSEFQNRLKERQWIKRYEKPQILYIYLTDTQWMEDVLVPINDYMQISVHDSIVKNQGRVSILRLSSMLSKWHLLLRENASVVQPPNIFSIPQLDTGDYNYGLVASLSASDDKYQQKPTTLIISECDIFPQFKPGIRKWTMAQGEDSLRWMTIKTWQEHKKYPCTNTWIWSGFSEKKKTLDQIHKYLKDNNKKDDIVSFDKKIDEEGFFSWNSKHNDLASKMLGGIYSFEYNRWILPKFWDEDGTRQWLDWAWKNKIYEDTSYKNKYSYTKHASSIKEEFEDRDYSLKERLKEQEKLN